MSLEKGGRSEEKFRDSRHANGQKLLTTSTGFEQKPATVPQSINNVMISEKKMKTIYGTLVLSLVALNLALPRETTLNLLTEGLSLKASTLSDSVALDNDYFRVLQNSAACTTAHSTNVGTRVIVALTNVKIESSKGTLTLERGNIAVFLAKESYKSPTGEFFEVAFKTNHPPLKAPEQWFEPEKNTIVYEDEQFRVFEERLPPHGERSLHSHAQRLVVRLNLVQLTDPRFQKNETPKGGIQVPNTVKFAEPVVHVVRNLSDIPLFNIVIEFKVPH
jgi:hypothetical protein